MMSSNNNQLIVINNNPTNNYAAEDKYNETPNNRSYINNDHNDKLSILHSNDNTTDNATNTITNNTYFCASKNNTYSSLSMGLD